MNDFPIFNLKYPKDIPGVNPDILNPAKTWKSQEEYQEALDKVAHMFKDNFKKFENDATDFVKSGGPQI